MRSSRPCPGRLRSPAPPEVTKRSEVTRRSGDAWLSDSSLSGDRAANIRVVASEGGAGHGTSADDVSEGGTGHGTPFADVSEGGAGHGTSADDVSEGGTGHGASPPLGRGPG
ncbi:hypothetical protein [Microbispora sp. H13382]|uniref:hypothetical protein n=1 Tax=Microbispora sp. H13382 TaxID=2729112 RepID=UPI0016031053|nr:hypothetical protein [Microbispora sp. H13382]